MFGVRQESNDGLTHRSRELLHLLSDFIKEKGYSPTLKEMRDLRGYRSTSPIQRQLERLQEEGYISNEYNRARTIKILKTKTDLGDV